MKTDQIIKDYGRTISPEVYMSALQGHQYIPQADECIRRIVRSYAAGSGGQGALLDLGCGPGRLTEGIAAEHPGLSVLGLDISESFILHAQASCESRGGIPNLRYLCLDFCADNIKSVSYRNWNLIMMQGVMHHIHGDDRVLFKKRCLDILTPGGLLIVGDEFIADYPNEATRRYRVCEFYLHIIDEARKGGFEELAREEAKNLVDDVLSGEEGAGFADDEILKLIYEYAAPMNDRFYSQGVRMESDMHVMVRDLVPQVRTRAKILATQNMATSFNRGDLKISTNKFIREMGDSGFALRTLYEIGPVQYLGGMAVMVFEKK